MIRKISKRDGLDEKAKSDIEHIKAALKEEPIVQKMFKKHKRNVDEIDNVSIKFDPNLDVSAKTINGDIFLNAEMLKDNWKDYFHYAIHEMQHYLVHTSGKCQDHNNYEYLDDPAEIEAFQNQLAYKEKTEPKAQVNEYLDELFDKHDLSKSDRRKKKKELLGEK